MPAFLSSPSGAARRGRDDRLRELTAASLIGKDEHDAYALTGLGRSLGTALAPLDQWAQTWSMVVLQEVQAQVESGT